MVKFSQFSQKLSFVHEFHSSALADMYKIFIVELMNYRTCYSALGNSYSYVSREMITLPVIYSVVAKRQGSQN